MKRIETEHSRKGKGHYSPGMVHNGVLYVSGQLSVDPATGRVPEGGVGAETRQALANVLAVLQSAGAGKEDVIQCRVYTPDVANCDVINEEYARFFGAHKPARVVVPTTMLHGGCLVEIEAIAAVD